MMDKIYGRPHGLRFVTFANPADSDKVLEQDHVIDGRPVRYLFMIILYEITYIRVTKRVGQMGWVMIQNG